MKKDLIFSPILLIVGVALFLLRFTGMPIHIAISVVGAIALVLYTVLTKKEWKIPALEIVMRALYGVALISGVVININYIFALAVALDHFEFTLDDTFVGAETVRTRQTLPPATYPEALFYRP